MKWVLNASPVICLARAGYERLLIDIPENSLIPEAVAEEIQAGPQDDPARRVMETGVSR